MKNQDQESFKALFDDIMGDQQGKSAAAPQEAGAAAEKKQPASPPSAPEGTQGVPDSDDLESLFDRVSEEKWGKPTPSTPSSQQRTEPKSAQTPVPDQKSATPQTDQDTTRATEAGDSKKKTDKDVYHRVGETARKINTLMRELGVDKFFQNTASEVMPDTRERLSFVADEMESASKKVLGLSEKSTDVINQMKEQSQALVARWDRLFEGQLPVAEFKTLCMDTHAALKGKNESYEALAAWMSDMVMSQSFQDLTGQVLQKVMKVSQELEKQLLSFLLDNVPPEIERESPLSKKQFLNGPNVKNKKASTESQEPQTTTTPAAKPAQPHVSPDTDLEEILTSQEEVDALLDSLGF